MCQCVGTLFRENGDSLLDLFCKSITMLCTWEWITNPSANMAQWNERFILFVCGVRLRYCMPFIVYSYSRLHPVLRFIPSLSSSHTWCMGVSWFFSFLHHVCLCKCHPWSLRVLSALFARHKQHLFVPFDSITCVSLHVHCIPNLKTTISIILLSFLFTVSMWLEVSIASGTFNIMNEQFKCEIFHFKQFNYCSVCSVYDTHAFKVLRKMEWMLGGES